MASDQTDEKRKCVCKHDSCDEHILKLHQSDERDAGSAACQLVVKLRLQRLTLWLVTCGGFFNFFRGICWGTAPLRIYIYIYISKGIFCLALLARLGSKLQ
jgi:hypothetical protein